MAYTPRDVPSDPSQLPDFLRTELLALARSFTDQVSMIQLQTLNVAPTKPREGMVVKFDGTNVNPGSGSGVYVYRAAAWHFLG